jgi:hypothetical protein
LNYKTRKPSGAFFGTVVGFLVIGSFYWAIEYSLGKDDIALKNLLEIPGLLLAIGYIFLLIGAINLRYQSNDKGITIIWGCKRIFIPFEEIQQITIVKGKSNFFSVFGVSWPGYMIGTYSVNGLGTVKMYATQPHQGFICLKTGRGAFGITPADDQMANHIAAQAQIQVNILDMDEMDPEKRGQLLQEDNFYQLLLRLNIIVLAIYLFYLGIFFPGSGAPRLLILLPVLAAGLFLFNLFNAARLYIFTSQGSYFLLVLSIAVTGIFFILSLGEITL